VGTIPIGRVCGGLAELIPAPRVAAPSRSLTELDARTAGTSPTDFIGPADRSSSASRSPCPTIYVAPGRHPTSSFPDANRPKGVTPAGPPEVRGTAVAWFGLAHPAPLIGGAAALIACGAARCRSTRIEAKFDNDRSTPGWGSGYLAGRCYSGRPCVPGHRSATETQILGHRGRSTGRRSPARALV